MNTRTSYTRSARSFTMRALSFIAALAAVLLVSACASDSKQVRTLDLALSQYEKAVRWSQWEIAMNHLAPDYLREHPISQLDLDRLRLYRVTQYSVRSSLFFDDSAGFRQVVEIRLFNTRQAVERSLVDQQEWRYDDERQRWLLTSGLPDVTRAR